MTVTQLRYFLSLTETLNFRATAARFFVAQTSVSYSIRSLESELGVRLFERTTKSVTLTDAGRSFAARVRPAVDILDLAQANIAHDVSRVPYTVGVSRLCSGPTFYAAVAAFQAQDPHFRVILDSDEQELTLLSQLSSGRIDAAVCFLASHVELPSGCAVRKFPASARRQAIVARTHPLAGKAIVTPQEFLAEQTVSYGDLERSRVLFDPQHRALEERSSRNAIIVRDFAAMLEMIGAGLGVACLPVLDRIDTAAVVSVPYFEPGAEPTTLGLLTMDDGPAAQALGDALGQALAANKKRPQD